MGYPEASPARDGILPRIAAGDLVAVEECLSRYGNLVWSLARRMTFNRNDTEDAVQEVFIDLWKSAARFDPDRAPESVFVTTIARRRLIDRRRRSKREPVLEPFYETAPNGEDLHDQTLKRLRVALLTEVMNDLPTDQRRVMALAVLDGLTHRQIASSTGLPLGTVKSHVRRGLVKVQGLLKRPRPRVLEGALQ